MDQISTLDLVHLRPLSTEQYEQCRNKALERVKSRIGDKPTRQQFQRELGRLWSILDVLAMIIFFAALVVSSLHIFVHMGQLANQSYSTFKQASAGTVITQDFFVAAHQWGMIFLSEASAILFLVMFGMTSGWRRWVALILAGLATCFVLVANLQSGVGLLESILPPAFTLGVGLRLELLITESLKRRDTITEQYLAALATWEAASKDATTHPEFMPLLRAEIWQKLVSLKPNQGFGDASPAFKAAATHRELARDSWAYEAGAVSAPLVEHGSLPTISADFLAPDPVPSSNGTGH